MEGHGEPGWDLPREHQPQAKLQKPKRRRIYITAPSGYTIQRLLMLGVTGAALFGGVMGDIWLWRLIYG